MLALPKRIYASWKGPLLKGQVACRSPHQAKFACRLRRDRTCSSLFSILRFLLVPPPTTRPQRHSCSFISLSHLLLFSNRPTYSICSSGWRHSPTRRAKAGLVPSSCFQILTLVLIFSAALLGPISNILLVHIT